MILAWNTNLWETPSPARKIRLSPGRTKSWNSQPCSPGRLNPWNWWKECSLTLKTLKNSLNWQETDKFEEKRAAAGRWMKSSPFLGHLPNSFLTRGRWFQSSPMRQVNRGVGNTACIMPPTSSTIKPFYSVVAKNYTAELLKLIKLVLLSSLAAPRYNEITHAPRRSKICVILLTRLFRRCTTAFQTNCKCSCSDQRLSV